MKILVRTIMKAVPGKMTEAVELEKKAYGYRESCIRDIWEVLPPP